jgi:hypothetical protein
MSPDASAETERLRHELADRLDAHPVREVTAHRPRNWDYVDSSPNDPVTARRHPAGVVTPISTTCTGDADLVGT